jgi:HEAT repeat protein
MGGSSPRVAAALLAFALVAAPAFGDEARQRLVQAKSLLRSMGEASVRKGAELCLEIGSADAMEALMDVLADDQPHYRDIVWEVIPKFKDPYARRVVATRFRGAAKKPRLRQWCAQAFEAFGVAEFLDPLREALAKGDAPQRAAAARAMGAIKDKLALPDLKAVLFDEDPFVRAAAMEAVARISPAEAKSTLWSGLHDADGGVRCAVLAAVPAIVPDLAEETAATALSDADWRPRFQGVENLCAAKTKTAIDKLLPATGDGRPVVARRANEWLQGVTGMKFTLPDAWRGWWKENREKFAFPEKPPDGGAPAKPEDKGRTFAVFNGIEVTSDHVAFLIDRSSDMQKTMKNGKTRDIAAREELETTLKSLPDGVMFDVVCYGAKTRSFAKTPVVLDAASRAEALKFVAGTKCEGLKDIWALLEHACSSGEIDTIYLLSSGEPEVGLYVHWNRVCEHLALLNRQHKIVIHGVSYTDVKWYRDQIEHIATSTGGKFVARE